MTLVGLLQPSCNGRELLNPPPFFKSWVIDPFFPTGFCHALLESDAGLCSCFLEEMSLCLCVEVATLARAGDPPVVDTHSASAAAHFSTYSYDTVFFVPGGTRLNFWSYIPPTFLRLSLVLGLSPRRCIGSAIRKVLYLYVCCS